MTIVEFSPGDIDDSLLDQVKADKIGIGDALMFAAGHVPDVAAGAELARPIRRPRVLGNLAINRPYIEFTESL